MKTEIQGILFDSCTVGKAVELALCGSNALCTVVTPNAVMLERVRREPCLRELLNSATLCLPDGAGVLMAARRQGSALKTRVAGIDFGNALLAAAAAGGEPIFLLGGAPGVADRAADRLANAHAGLLVCGTQHGYYSPDEEPELLHRIRESGAEILLVCLGFPRQERWMAKNLPKLPRVRVAAALGGSLDVWAGDRRRAPIFLQKCGMEWAWRMCADPKKFAQLPLLLRFALFSSKIAQKPCTKCTQEALRKSKV